MDIIAVASGENLESKKKNMIGLKEIFDVAAL